MTLHGKHFDIIEERALRPFGVAIKDIKEVSNDPDPHGKKHHSTIRSIFNRFGNDIKISRTIHISQIDLEDNYTVEFIEALEDPHYVVSTRKWSSNAENPRELEYVCGQIEHFLHKNIEVKAFPTAEQVNHLKTLRGWGGGADAELYFDNGEYSEGWKIRLIDADTKEPYVEYLPTDISGAMVQTLHSTYKRGVLRGEIAAINRMAERLAADEAKRVLNATHIRSHDVNNRLSEFIHSGSLAAINTTTA
jgi:hypothetical protein